MACRSNHVVDHEIHKAESDYLISVSHDDFPGKNPSLY